MKLNDMFNETVSSAAAHKMGLTSIGFGRWADKSGKVVAKTVGGKLTPVKPKKRLKPKQKSDAPSKGKEALPIHRDFDPGKVKANAPMPKNREQLPVHPDFDPTQTAQPTANQPKRSEPKLSKVSSADRAAAGDYNADDDPTLGRNKPKSQGPQSDAKKKFKPLVKGADGKWGSSEPAPQKPAKDFKPIKKKSSGMKIDNVLKSIKDKFR